MLRRKQSTPEDWPAVDTAYGLLVPSYQITIDRYNTVNGRLQHFVTFSTALFAALLLFAIQVVPGASFVAPMFILGSLLVGLSVSGALVSLQRGRIDVIGTKRIWDHHLDSTAWQFKVDQIKAAAEASDKTTKLIERKHKALTWLLFAFVVGVAFIVSWVAVEKGRESEPLDQVSETVSVDSVWSASALFSVQRLSVSQSPDPYSPSASQLLEQVY